jgi:two-component system sensor histidine kinase/response regulator
MMGGSIGINSAPGQGSDFHFTANFGLGNAEGAATAPLVELSRLRVLVVDDNVHAREILSSLLGSLGCLVTEATSAVNALQALRRADLQQPYDVVMMDWKMPGMDGFEAARSIRADAGLRRQPRISLVTGYQLELGSHGVDAQMFDTQLTKPVSASSLLDALATMLGQRMTPAQGASDGLPRVAPADTAHRLRGMRVLLVEDNEINQQVAAELLCDAGGVLVTIASNGREALDRLANNTVDAVLMDIQMPEMDGYETTAQIRGEARWAKLPIIAMTAHAMVKDRDRCLAAGMNDYVTKPFDPTELFDVLAKWAPDHAVPAAPVTPAAEDRQGDPAAIDFERGLMYCLDRPALYNRLLGTFARTGATWMSEVCAAIERGDLPTATLMAHTLKANAGTIGAKPLAVLVGRLETALGAGPLGDETVLLAPLGRELAAVLAEADAYLNEAVNPS